MRPASCPVPVLPRLLLAATLVMLAFGGASSVTARSEAPTGAIDATTATEMLPNLRMAKLRDMQVQVQTNGDVWLRFTTISMNAGAGPFEVVGALDPNDPTTMTTKQRIYDSDGHSHLIDRAAIAHYSGDGHDHWHILKVQRYQLWRKDAPDGPIQRGQKIGFCFFDNANMRPNLPGHPTSEQYGGGGCGTSDSTTIQMGMSVGWGDVYPWEIAFQEIDITGLASGDYRVCVTIDPQRLFRESDRTDNQVWSDITLVMDGTPSVVTIAHDWGPCR
jgi:hypothetical protein